MNLGTLVLLLITVAGRASADPASQALQLLDRGAALYANGDYEGALRAFAEAQALVPERANPYRWLALTNAQLGRCSEASAHLEIFLKLVSPGDERVAEVALERDHCLEAAKQAAPVPEAAPPTAVATSRAPTTVVPPARAERRPLYPLHKKWWFWTVVGVAVAGAAVAIGVAAYEPSRAFAPPN